MDFTPVTTWSNPDKKIVPVAPTTEPCGGETDRVERGFLVQSPTTNTVPITLCAKGREAHGILLSPGDAIFWPIRSLADLHCTTSAPAQELRFLAL
jgi:hypothetical protein